MIRKGILTLLFIIVGFYITAQDYTGREIVGGGAITTIEGLLEDIDDELYITVEGIQYQIHLGPEDYIESIGFKKESGITAIVKGFLLGGHIAPIDIIILDKTYQFWDLSGAPMWRGKSYTSSNGDEDHDEH